ncbi:hypothetical protein A5652_07195 [Mycobacterium sp. 1165178.9]|nr:hypothetical protein A5652_07195 [Mycobacterium sp. 1165178.9]
MALQREGHVLLIGLNRPHKRDAVDRAMLADLSRAYGVLESDPSVRAGVLYAQGKHFTAGLDLIDVGPGIASGELCRALGSANVRLAARSGANVWLAARSAYRR